MRLKVLALSMAVVLSLLVGCSSGEVEVPEKKYLSQSEAQMAATQHVVANNEIDEQFLRITRTEKRDTDWIVHFATEYPQGWSGIPYSASITVNAESGEITNAEEAF